MRPKVGVLSELSGCCAPSHWCQWAPGTRSESGRGCNGSEVWVLRSVAQILVQITLIIAATLNGKLSDLLFLSILASISVTTLDITVTQPGFSFLSHVHVSFSQKTSLPCPGYSRNVDKSCQGLNTEVLGWGKKKRVWVLVKGEHNLWFWSKHSSFG